MDDNTDIIEPQVVEIMKKLVIFLNNNDENVKPKDKNNFQNNIQNLISIILRNNVDITEIIDEFKISEEIKKILHDIRKLIPFNYKLNQDNKDSTNSKTNKYHTEHKPVLVDSYALIKLYLIEEYLTHKSEEDTNILEKALPAEIKVNDQGELLDILKEINEEFNITDLIRDLKDNDKADSEECIKKIETAILAKNIVISIYQGLGNEYDGSNSIVLLNTNSIIPFAELIKDSPILINYFSGNNRKQYSNIQFPHLLNVSPVYVKTLFTNNPILTKYMLELWLTDCENNENSSTFEDFVNSFSKEEKAKDRLNQHEIAFKIYQKLSPTEQLKLRSNKSVYKLIKNQLTPANSHRRKSTKGRDFYRDFLNSQTSGNESVHDLASYPPHIRQIIDKILKRKANSQDKLVVVISGAGGGADAYAPFYQIEVIKRTLENICKNTPDFNFDELENIINYKIVNGASLSVGNDLIDRRNILGLKYLSEFGHKVLNGKMQKGATDSYSNIDTSSRTPANIPDFRKPNEETALGLLKWKEVLQDEGMKSVEERYSNVSMSLLNITKCIDVTDTTIEKMKSDLGINQEKSNVVGVLLDHGGDGYFPLPDEVKKDDDLGTDLIVSQALTKVCGVKSTFFISLGIGNDGAFAHAKSGVLSIIRASWVSTIGAMDKSMGDLLVKFVEKINLKPNRTLSTLSKAANIDENKNEDISISRTNEGATFKLNPTFAQSWICTPATIMPHLTESTKTLAKRYMDKKTSNAKATTSNVTSEVNGINFTQKDIDLYHKLAFAFMYSSENTERFLQDPIKTKYGESTLISQKEIDKFKDECNNNQYLNDFGDFNYSKNDKIFEKLIAYIDKDEFYGLKEYIKYVKECLIEKYRNREKSSKKEKISDEEVSDEVILDYYKENNKTLYIHFSVITNLTLKNTNDTSNLPRGPR